MGETQIYSQRLHGINEKRRILGEMDVIQRELELQKVKLQQLKRKSLRDRWLMDGLVPTPGTEIENPLSETEDNIKKLQDELESLQLQLVYLENPELKIENLKKHQKPLVNGDQSQQIFDQKDPTPSRREIQKEHKVIQEEYIQPNGEEEKQGEDVDRTQKDPTPSKEVVEGHPTPAHRGTRVSGNQMEKNQDQSSPDQKSDIVDQRNEEHDKEIQNLNRHLEPQDDTSENLGSNEELKGESLDREHVYTDHNSECLDKRLGFEEENMEHLSKGLEHVDLNFLNAESRKVYVSPPSLSDEGIMKNSDLVKVLVLDKIELHEDETQPSPIMEKHDEPSDNNQGGEGKPVSVSIIQDQDKEIKVPVGNQDQNEESALPRCQEEPVDPLPVLIGHDKGQDLKATSYAAHQSLVILSSDQGPGTELPCNDPDPSVSLPCEDLVSQVQIVISISGHTSSGEAAQHSSRQGPSTDHIRPDTTEASTPAESQPLLHKLPETDAQSGPHGTNTAETRDKNPPAKKKSCQCCVVM